MLTPRLTLLLLALTALGACSRSEAPRQPEGGKTTEKPKPYTGYEGYTLLFDSGLAHVLTSGPDEVGGQPHLFLLDRSGKRSHEVLADLLGDYEGRGRFCEGTMTEAGAYLALLAKYDFTRAPRHQSRLLLLDKRTLRLISNRTLTQPGRGGDEWVRQSFTLADGSTYLTFDKRSYYLLPRDGSELTKLSLPVAYAKAAYAWGVRGYFFLEDQPEAYAFAAGETTPTKLPLFPGSAVRTVYPAGGEWLVLQDEGRGYQLFSMKTGRSVLRFTLSEATLGRSMVYDAVSQRLFFTGGQLANSSSESRERSVYEVQLPQKALLTGEDVGKLTASLLYRVDGRSEGDNRIGMQMQLGLQPERRELLVSWLDQGRGGTNLRPVSKVVVLPLDASPAVPLAHYTFDAASDIRSIFPLARVE